jgi:transcriptional regulator with XRE-family HTH domain
MATTLKDKIAQLPPEQQAEIAVEAERLRTEYLTLKDLRRARQLTQVQLAETLGQKQVSVAKLEKRTDLLLSTLRRYVEAMGGTLDLVVAFPDRPPVHLEGLGEADDPPSRTTAKGESRSA